MKKVLIPLLMVLCLLPSCTFERNEEVKTEKLERPDMVLERGTMQVHTGEEPVMLSSEKITYYSIDEYAELGPFTFSQKDKDGNIRLEGSADKGKINTKTRVLTLEGDIHMKDMESGLVLQTTGVLVFDIENEEVTTDESVMVEYEEGVFRGTGFYGNLRKEEYSFREIEEGRLEV